MSGDRDAALRHNPIQLPSVFENLIQKAPPMKTTLFALVALSATLASTALASPAYTCHVVKQLEGSPDFLITAPFRVTSTEVQWHESFAGEEASKSAVSDRPKTASKLDLSFTNMSSRLAIADLVYYSATVQNDESDLTEKVSLSPSYGEPTQTLSIETLVLEPAKAPVKHKWQTFKRTYQVHCTPIVLE